MGKQLTVPGFKRVINYQKAEATGSILYEKMAKRIERGKTSEHWLAGKAYA